MIDRIPRRVGQHIKELVRHFPVLSITGPRQAGKTTLARMIFPEYRYVNFEDIRYREAFERDPLAFLDDYDRHVIFDEAQRVPTLFNYLLIVVDEDREPGRYVLTGSQNFLMVREIDQSLAGRVGTVRLLPLDFAELTAYGTTPNDPATSMYQGYYPGPYQNEIPPQIYYSDYVASYLDRDITHLIKKSNMLDFRRFLTIAASMVGNTLNYTAVANNLRVTVNTVKQWVHYLRQTYIAFTVTPYSLNTNKRISKQPKLFFYDTGLACFLQNLRDPEAIRNANHYGNLFENMVIANIQKQRYHDGDIQEFYFYRDANQLEADYVDGFMNVKEVAEIKASKRARDSYGSNLRKVSEIVNGSPKLSVIYGGTTVERRGDCAFYPWFAYPPVL